MGGIFRLLKSSRFWVTVGIAVPAALAGQWAVAGAAVIAYVTGTAIEDAAAKLGKAVVDDNGD